MLAQGCAAASGDHGTSKGCGFNPFRQFPNIWPVSSILDWNKAVVAKHPQYQKAQTANAD